MPLVLRRSKRIIVAIALLVDDLTQKTIENSDIVSFCLFRAEVS